MTRWTAGAITAGCLATLALAGCGAVPVAPPAPTDPGEAASPADAAAVSIARDKLKGTTKTQGDFNLAHRFIVKVGDTPVNGILGATGFVAPRTVNGKPELGSLTLFKTVEPKGVFETWPKGPTGQPERKSGSIVVLDKDGKALETVAVFGLFPRKIMREGRNSGHATEKIEVAFERFELKPN